METIDKIKAIIRNDKVSDAMFNLCDRWQDESKYENINDYAKAIFGVVTKEFPDYGTKLIGATKRPFGLKMQVDDKKFHVYLKIEGGYMKMYAKLI